MANRNVDKGREAENAVAFVLQQCGMPDAERRSKRGGTVELSCPSCEGAGGDSSGKCWDCQGEGRWTVPADAGDIVGVPRVVVQVKWSAYKPLHHDLRRTEEQRRVAGADIGLLVRKRKAVGCGRAGEWDAYLPAAAVQRLMGRQHGWLPDPDATWHTDLRTAARLMSHAGYGDATARLRDRLTQI